MIIDINNRIGTRPLRSFRSADLLLREMDAAGVDRAVISCFPTQDENAVVLEAIHAHPDRLSGMFLINPHQKQAEASYRRAIEQGFCSLRLEPLAHGFSVDDLALLSPLMQVCAAFETPVWIYGTADVCCAPILFQDLAEAFLSVPVIIGYMGYNYEASSAISIAKRYANIYLDPTAAMKQNLMRAVNTAGPEKLLLGSGTPVASYFELEIEKIRLIESDPARQQLMLGGNAIRLFRL